MSESKKILVVDDEPDFRALVRFRLEQEGYDVETAETGFEALGAARAGRPDLVILDVMLPEENGYRVARMLREDEEAGIYPGGLGIILLTARDLRSDPDRERMFLSFTRADRMIYKPCDLEEVVLEVERILADRGTHGAGATAVM